MEGEGDDHWKVRVNDHWKVRVDDQWKVREIIIGR